MTANAPGIKKVLFVCTANVCRSPMAEAIFEALVSDRSIPWEARSAGVAALVDESITPYAKAILEELGVYPGGHRARQVEAAMLEEADLVLAMDPWHTAALRRLCATSSEKIYILPGYVQGVPDGQGIPDPYGQSMAAHRASAREILWCVDRLVSRLKGAPSCRDLSR